MKEKIIDNEKLKTYIQITRIAIVICWCALFAFWAIKVFGGNWFEIAVQNENFVKFSKKLETTWLKYLVSFITIALSNYITLCAVCQKFYFTKIQSLFAWAIIVTMWVVANFVDVDFLKAWYGYILIIVFGVVYQHKWKKLFGLFSMILDFCFMTISMLVRNIPLAVTSNYLIASILIFDMYIMVFLYYLYSNLIKMKKEIK